MQAILRHVSWICRTLRQLRSASCGYVERSASFAPPLVDMSNAPPASLHLSWICRTPRQLRSGSRGYIERSASFAPALVDMSNAPPASLRLSWIYRTLRQLRSGSRGYVERSASFAPALVDMSTGRLRFTAASVGVFQHPASASPNERPGTPSDS